MLKIRSAWYSSRLDVRTADVPATETQILCLSDADAKWSSSMGLSVDLSARGMGVRTARYAMIINDLKVEHIAVSLFSFPGSMQDGVVANNMC